VAGFASPSSPSPSSFYIQIGHSPPSPSPQSFNRRCSQWKDDSGTCSGGNVEAAAAAVVVVVCCCCVGKKNKERERS